MQVSCLKSKANMVAGTKRDTTQVVHRYLNMIRIQTQQTSSTRCRVLGLAQWYGVATMSRMLKNTGLFAEYRSLL